MQYAHLARTHYQHAFQAIRSPSTVHQPAPTWVTEERYLPQLFGGETVAATKCATTTNKRVQVTRRNPASVQQSAGEDRLKYVHRSDSSVPKSSTKEGSLIAARDNLGCLRSPLCGHRSMSPHHGVGSRLNLCVCATEVTLEVILCEYSRRALAILSTQRRG